MLPFAPRKRAHFRGAKGDASRKHVNRTNGGVRLTGAKGQLTADGVWSRSRTTSVAGSVGGQLVAPGQPEHEDLSLPRIQTAGLQRAISKAPGGNRGSIDRNFGRHAAEPQALKRRSLSNHVCVKTRLTCGKVRVNLVRVRCLRSNAQSMPNAGGRLGSPTSCAQTVIWQDLITTVQMTGGKSTIFRAPNAADCSIRS
jgi:hypothetical protein